MSDNDIYDLDRVYLPKQRKNPLLKVLVALFCVLIAGGGSFAYIQIFQRDVALLVMGEEKYAQKIETKSMEVLSKKLTEYLTYMVMENTTNSSFKTDLEMDFMPENSFYEIMDKEVDGLEIESIKSIINYFNTMQMSITSSVSDKGSIGRLEISENTGSVLTVKNWSDKTSTTFQIPEISSKYFQLPIKSEIKLSDLLIIDKVKLNASLLKVMTTYMDTIKEAKITVTDEQTVTIDTVSITAKKVSLSLTEEQVMKACNIALTSIRDDLYLQEMIVKSANSVMEYYQTTQTMDSTFVAKEKFTVQNYKDALDKFMATLESFKTNTGIFSVNTYINRQNKVVARTYKITDETEVNENLDIQLITPPSNEIPGQTLINILYNGKETMRATVTPSSLTNGTATVIYKDTKDNTTVGLNIDYKDFGKKTWNNKEIPTGKFTLSILDPDNKIAKSMKELETFPDILKSTLTIGCDVQNNAMKYSFSLPLKGVGAIDVNASNQIIAPILFEMPVITTENSYVMDPLNPTKIFDKETMDEMIKGGVIHAYGIAKRNSALAQILDQLGFPMADMEAFVNSSKIQ